MYVWIVLGKAAATSKVDFVDIDPCVKQPCELKKGSEETIHVQFTLSRDRYITANVNSNKKDVWFVYKISNPKVYVAGKQLAPSIIIVNRINLKSNCDICVVL